MKGETTKKVFGRKGGTERGSMGQRPTLLNWAVLGGGWWCEYRKKKGNLCTGGGDARRKAPYRKKGPGGGGKKGPRSLFSQRNREKKTERRERMGGVGLVFGGVGGVEAWGGKALPLGRGGRGEKKHPNRVKSEKKKTTRKDRKESQRKRWVPGENRGQPRRDTKITLKGPHVQIRDSWQKTVVLKTLKCKKNPSCPQGATYRGQGDTREKGAVLTVQTLGRGTWGRPNRGGGGC